MTHTIKQSVRYLDLDDDGVPDAILITQTLADDHDITENGSGSTVVETLESEIGIDGRPHRISVFAHH